MPFSATRTALRLVMMGGAGLAMVAALTPASAQTAPTRGVFVTQIGESSRADVSQQNSDSLARIVQDGDRNQTELDQTGDAAHRAQIAQAGDRNIVTAEQDGDGPADLTLVQEGDRNTADVQQREESATNQTAAAILQRGNGNSIILAQDGSDNDALLNQVGDNNIMTATQEGTGNRLEWTQIGDGLADMQVLQTGNGSMQITQSNVGAAFAPPPSSPGG